MTAMIGFDSLFLKGTLSTDPGNGALDDFPIEHGFDWVSYTTYKPFNFTIENWIQVDLASSQPADYVGIGYFDPGLRPGGADAELFVETSLTGGPPWVTVHTVTIITDPAGNTEDTGVIFETFNEVSSQHWRVRHTNGNFVFGVMAVGKRLDLPTVAQLPTGPPQFGNKDKIIMNLSEDGESLGLSGFNRGNEFQLNLDVLEPLFIRTNWDALKEHALTRPFFFKWDDSPARTRENALLWPKKVDDLKPVYGQPLFLKINMDCNAFFGPTFRT